MNDLEIKEFESKVIGAINSANLPLEVKRLVLHEIYISVVNATDASVKVIAEQNEKTAVETE